MRYQRPSKTITGTYTITDSDNGYTIQCNSATPFTVSLPSAVGRPNFDVLFENKGAGAMTCDNKVTVSGSHSHLTGDGSAWNVSVETDPAFLAWLTATPPLYSEADPVFLAWLLATPPIYSEIDPDFNAWLSATPPLYSEIDPDFNAWLSGYRAGHVIWDETGTGVAQEPNLWFTGRVSVSDNSGEEATVINIPIEPLKYQQWDGFPDSPQSSLVLPYQLIIAFPAPENGTFLFCYDLKPYTVDEVYSSFSVYMLTTSGWSSVFSGSPSMSNVGEYYIFSLACNFDIYDVNTSPEYGTLKLQHFNDVRNLEPITNGDPYNPEFIFDSYGDIIMGYDYQLNLNAIVSNNEPN